MDMKKMMKQAQKMQRDLAIAQEEIKSMEFEASAGGGMVKAVAAGDAVLPAHIGRQLLLQLRDLLAADEMGARQDAADVAVDLRL